MRRSTHRRATVDAGQLVCVRKIRVSSVIGVRNWRTAVLSSAGVKATVGRLAPLTITSGRMEVKVRKKGGLLLGLGARKNGRASAWPDNSYWVVMELMSRLRGVSW